MLCKVVSRLFSCSFLASVGLLAASSAQAAVYYDHDPINRTLTRNNPTYSSDFNIYNQVNWDSERVASGVVGFVFLDFDNKEERVEIELGEEVIDGGRIRKGITIFGGLLSCDAIMQLNETGMLSYEIRLQPGSDSVKLVSGTLIACTTPYSPPGNRVPDGGTTVAMLGLAMLVVGGAHRKFRGSARA